MLTLALSNLWVGLMVALFLFVCVLLILTVLIQRPQGGGLSGAFGSNAGSGQTAFGAKTGDALTIATILMFVVYIVAAIGLNYAVRPTIAAVTTPTAEGTGPGDSDAGAGAGAAGDTQPESTPPAEPAPVPLQPKPTEPAPTPPASTPPASTSPAPTEPPASEPAGDPQPAGDPG